MDVLNPYIIDYLLKLKFIYLQILRFGTRIARGIYMQSAGLKIKSSIQDIYNGENGTPSNVAKEHTNLYLRARKVFGSWKNAVEASGIDYENTRNHKKWNRDKIINEIKELHNQGHNLRPWSLRKNGKIKLLSAANYHFGSWKKAVLASSISYSYARNRSNGKCTSE